MVEYLGWRWKVAYVGPVYHADGIFLGLVAMEALTDVQQTIPQGALVSKSPDPPGDMCGSVDGASYFVCPPNHGLLVLANCVVPHPLPNSLAEIATCTATCSAPVDEVDNVMDDMCNGSVVSISGLVVGTQSVRRLRDASHDPCALTEKQFVSVASETDPFVATMMESLPTLSRLLAPIESGSRDKVLNDSIDDVIRVWMQPLNESLQRCTTTALNTFLPDEKKWLDDVKVSLSALQQPFQWEKMLADPACNVAETIDKVLDTSEDVKDVNLARADGSRLHSAFLELEELFDKVVVHRCEESVTETHVPVARALRKTELKQAAMWKQAIDEALTPVHQYAAQYATLPKECLHTSDTAGLWKTHPDVAKMLEQKVHGEEILSRSQFAIETASHDVSQAAAEGRVEDLERFCHLRVELAQQMQRASCSVLDVFPLLEEKAVNDPRKELREAVKKLDVSFAKDLSERVATELQRITALIDGIAAEIAESEEAFVRDAFSSSSRVVECANTIVALHDEETAMVNLLAEMCRKWAEIRRRKWTSISRLKQLHEQRAASFATHHRETASRTLTLLMHQREAGITSRVGEVVSEIGTTWLRRAKEAEESVLMELQRTLFEEKTAAHEKHKHAFQHLCVAAEDLAFRKEQVHGLICERLDRCKMEFELAVDSLDERSKGISRELQELERVAKEVHLDVSAIRSIAQSSGAVFEERTATFFIECGKPSDDPRDEVKRLTLERKQKLLTSIQSLDNGAK